LEFWILEEMQKMKNQICCRKGEKSNDGFLERKKIKKCKWWKKCGKIKYE
jgi:hypothetical protein